MPSEKPAANGEPPPPHKEEGKTSASRRRLPHLDDTPSQDFVRLLDYLKANRGFDFSGYKLSSLIRRVQKRMQEVGVASFNDYIDHLEVHPDEFLPLFNTVLINVTGFFRDPQAWQTLATQVLPRILESKGNDEPIRCWSAGCAAGQEAYTLAILLSDPRHGRLGCSRRFLVGLCLDGPGADGAASPCRSSSAVRPGAAAGAGALRRDRRTARRPRPGREEEH
jgi:hypothetical protein